MLRTQQDHCTSTSKSWQKGTFQEKKVSECTTFTTILYQPINIKTKHGAHLAHHCILTVLQNEPDDIPNRTCSEWCACTCKASATYWKFGTPAKASKQAGKEAKQGKQGMQGKASAKQVLSKSLANKASKEASKQTNSCTSSSLCGRKADLLGGKRTALRAADFRTGLHDLHHTRPTGHRFVVLSKQRAVKFMSKHGNIGTLLHAWSMCAWDGNRVPGKLGGFDEEATCWVVKIWQNQSGA